MAESDVPKEFRDAVAELLYYAQVIEWMLRIILSDMNEAADNALKGKGIRFKARRDDLERYTLGRLIELYAQHSDDDALVKRLDAFKVHRNKAAHVFLVAGWLHRGDPKTLADGVARVHELVREAKDLADLVTVESARSYLVAHPQPENAVWQTARETLGDSQDPAAR